MNKGHDFILASQRMMSVFFLKELHSSEIQHGSGISGNYTNSSQDQTGITIKI